MLFKIKSPAEIEEIVYNILRGKPFLTNEKSYVKTISWVLRELRRSGIISIGRDERNEKTIIIADGKIKSIVKKKFPSSSVFYIEIEI